MNKVIAFLIVVVCTVSCFAQTQTTTKKTTFSVAVDEHTVIKDGTGKRVEYAEAMRQIASGRSTLDPVRDKDGMLTHFLIRAKIDSDSSRRETQLRTLQSENSPLITPGIALKSFSVETMSGEVLSSEKLKGKILVFNFWFSMCKPCQNEIGELNELVAKFKDNNDVVFIAPDWEKKDAVAAFLEKKPMSYKVCPAATSLIDSIKLKSYPTHLVVDKTGVIFSSYSGGLAGIGTTLEEDILEALKE
jgi:thiol-disulfide isomerase/thioredoxin